MKPGLEYYECVLFADWCDRKKLFFTHFPAGENRDHRERINMRSGRLIRYSPAGKKLRRMGLRPGVSDYLIFDPPPLHPDAKGTVVELKKPNGSGPTYDQMEFIEEMRKRGWIGGWFKGADRAIEWLTELGYGKRPGGAIK